MLRVLGSVGEVREAVRAAKREGRLAGLVPTMGALHEGHARLVESCRDACGFVAVSIFVNPTQFGPNEDYGRYPRTFEADRALCEARGADLIFLPSVEAMYPRGGAGSTFVEVPGITEVLEGASRPGHFRGVATVVLKLFTACEPDLAFFGAKDFQQQLVIRRMTEDLNLSVGIRTVATVREGDGLALSSRNRYLGPEERRAATVLWRALNRAREAVGAGERDGERVRRVLTETIESEPMARIDYAAVVDAETLATLSELDGGRRAVALLAVRFGSTRLIDNAMLTD